MDRLIKAQHGLSIIYSNEYARIYGPTAILIVILSFWRRVDYYHKAAQPWRNLFAGPVSADSSVLLDYVTPFQAVSLFRALKNRHYAVAVTITSFFLLKFIILLSTALFTPGISLQADSFDIRYENSFNTPGAWNSTDLGDIDPWTGPDEPAWAYLGRLNNATTVDPHWKPPGNLVTQKFTGITETKANVTSLQAPVDVFVPKISCEEGETFIEPYQLNGLFMLRVNTTSCSGVDVNVELCADYSVEGGETVWPCSANERFYSIEHANCSSDLESDDIRYTIMIREFRPTINSSDLTVVDWMKMYKVSCVFCTFGYGIISANATLDMLTGEVTFAEGSLEQASRLISSLSSIPLAESLIIEYPEDDGSILDSRLPDRYETSHVSLQTFPRLLSATLGYPKDRDIFHQPEVLKNGSALVLEGVALEFAHQSLLQNDATPGIAQGFISKTKVFARPIALWVMVASFFIMAMITMSLFWVPNTYAWFPAMSGSIAGHAAVLAESPTVHQLLANTGHYKQGQLKERLSGLDFVAQADPTDGLSIQVQGMLPMALEPCRQQIEVKWEPLAARRAVVALTIFLALAAIGILELLYRLSLQREGLITINNEDTAATSYMVRIASALSMFIIATMFNNFDFTVAMLAPYSSMRHKGGAEANRSILSHLLSASPFLVFFKALRQRQYGAAASNMASIIAGFLTIIVSGLWIQTGPLGISQTEMASVNNWDRGWLNNFSDDRGAAARLDTIRHHGAATPAGIWEDLVMPKISLSSPLPDNKTRSSGGHEHTFHVRALRPLMSCVVVPLEDVTIDEQFDGISPNPIVHITINSTVPLECTLDASLGGKGNFSFDVLVFPFLPGGWVGNYVELDNSTANAACPSVGIVFGAPYRGETFADGLTVLACTQKIEEVPVIVTFDGDPALGRVSLKKPPVVSSKNSQYLRNSTNDASTLGFRLDDLASHLTELGDASILDSFDPFFQHLVARDRYSRDELLGPANVEKLMQAVASDYSEYMRHVIDLNFRANEDGRNSSLYSASNDTPSPLTINSTITGTISRQVTRLAIDRTSKLILQIMLAVMTLLGVLAYTLVRFQGTLPQEPCSIASAMSLLAGSQLCIQGGIIPDKPAIMTDQQLEHILKGKVFSLGWWSTREETLREPLLAGEEIAHEFGDPLEDTLSVGEEFCVRFGIDVGECLPPERRCVRLY